LDCRAIRKITTDDDTFRESMKTTIFFQPVADTSYSFLVQRIIESLPFKLVSFGIIAISFSNPAPDEK